MIFSFIASSLSEKRWISYKKDPTNPMPKDTILDVLRILVGILVVVKKSIKFSFIVKPERFLKSYNNAWLSEGSHQSSFDDS
ncbi:hypothetical protein Bca101_030775 [Brassica carinata]